MRFVTKKNIKMQKINKYYIYNIIYKYFLILYIPLYWIILTINATSLILEQFVVSPTFDCVYGVLADDVSSHLIVLQLPVSLRFCFSLCCRVVVCLCASLCVCVSYLVSHASMVLSWRWCFVCVLYLSISLFSFPKQLHMCLCVFSLSVIHFVCLFLFSRPVVVLSAMTTAS